MIKFYNGIPDSETSILRKIGFDVLDQLYNITNLPKNAPVFINGASDTAPIKNDNLLNSENDRPMTIQSNSRNVVKVSIEEEQEPGTSQTVPMYKAEEESIFQDDELGIVIYPSYQTTRLVLSLQVHFASKKRAIMWMQELNGKFSSGYEHATHLLTYSYAIPEQTIFFLKHAYDLKEKIGGNGETFDEWLKRIGNKRLTTVVNHAANNATYTMPENQANAVGKFEFGEVPKGDMSDTAGYELNVEYVVIFKRPFNVIVSTPTVIHQQLLNKNYAKYGYHLAYDPRTIFTGGGTFAKIMEENTYRAIPAVWYENGIRVPWYDTWRPLNKLPYVHTVINLLVTLPEPSDTLLCTLPNMNDRYTIEPTVAAYIAAAGEDALKYGCCAVKFSLFANSHVLQDNALRFEGNELHINVPINVKKIYHLTLELNPALAKLNEAQLELLRNHGEACRIIFKRLCPHLEKMGIMPKLLPNGRVTLPELKAAIAYMDKFVKGINPLQQNGWWMLQTQYTLIADKQLPKVLEELNYGHV